MSVISQHLSALSLGAPTHAGRLTLFPLLTEGALTDYPYLLLDEALGEKQLEISEVSEAGIVANLLAINHSGKPVLLFDGEELKGAKQNRIVNATILVPPASRLTLPVSCVEQGRWRYEAADFSSSGETLFAKARLSKAVRMASARRMKVARQVNAGWTPEPADEADQNDMFASARDVLRDYDAGQHAVWEDVEEALRETGTHSASSAMHDSYTLRREEIARLASSFTVSERQVGAVFFIDGRPVGAEVADRPASFASVFGKLVRSYCLNALGEAVAPCPVPATDDALAFTRSIADLDQMVSPSVGLGDDVRIDGPLASGSALLNEGKVVHLSVFSKAAFEPAN